MDVNFKYNNAPLNGIPKIIESVSSEIPGGVMIRGSELSFPFVLEGTPVVMDSEGNYFLLSTDVTLSSVKVIGVLGESFEGSDGHNNEDRLCRVVTGGVINSLAWKKFVVQAKYKNALTEEVENMLAPAITFNPPVNAPQGIV